MVVKKFDNIDYEFLDVGYGQVLDIQDMCTVIDTSVDPPVKKLLGGKFTRELALLMVRKDGKPVNINDPKQCPITHGAWIDTELNAFLSSFKAKNVQSGQKEAQ